MKEQIFRLCKRLKKCTLNDLVQLLEVEGAIIQTALLALEQENLIVTLGEKGCFIKAIGETIPAFPCGTAVDTTGAGDTFNGVLAACIASGDDIRSACRKANIAGWIKVTRKYIMGAIPHKKEIEKWI